MSAGSASGDGGGVGDGAGGDAGGAAYGESGRRTVADRGRPAPAAATASVPSVGTLTTSPALAGRRRAWPAAAAACGRTPRRRPRRRRQRRAPFSVLDDPDDDGVGAGLGGAGAAERVRRHPGQDTRPVTHDTAAVGSGHDDDADLMQSPAARPARRPRRQVRGVRRLVDAAGVPLGRGQGAHRGPRGGRHLRRQPPRQGDGRRARRRGVRQRDADQRPGQDRARPGAVHAVLRRGDRRHRRRPDRLLPATTSTCCWSPTPPTPPRSSAGCAPRRPTASRSPTTTATTPCWPCRARGPTRCSTRSACRPATTT